MQRGKTHMAKENKKYSAFIFLSLSSSHPFANLMRVEPATCLCTSDLSLVHASSLTGADF